VTVPELSYFAKHPMVRKLLLPAVALLFFVLFLVLTFPYDALARRLEAEAQREGAELTIGKLGPAGLLSFRAREVRVRLPPSPGIESPPELKLDSATLSPDVFPLLLRRTSFGFSLKGYGGTADGHLALSNDARSPGLTSLRLDARDVDLATVPARDMGGVAAAGKVQLKIELSSLQPVETASGGVQLSAEGVVLSGSMMGVQLPRTSLGRIEGTATVDKGVAKIEKTTARGGDVEVDADGNVALRPLFSLSQADLHVRFRPAERWLGSNPAVRGMMGLISSARQSDGAYLYSMNGPVSRLQPRPGR
jgi:type II secretion system protein N